MAATYTPQNALTHAKAFIKSMPLDTADSGTLQYRLVDYASSLLWVAAPWSWTLGSVTNVSVVGGTYSYSWTPPSDFLYATKATLSDGNQERDVKVVSHLQPPTQIGNPSRVFYDVANTAIIVTPLPPTSYAETLVTIYKKQPPKITSGNFSTTGALVFPDCYMPVLQAAVLWQAYAYADDERGGACTVTSDGKAQWTQQAGIFYGMVEEMRKAEKLIVEYPDTVVSRG